MKAPLRPFEYMAWAHDVRVGARYDLSASGMADTVLSQSDALGLYDELSVERQCNRDARDKAVAEFIEAIAERYGVDTDHVTPTLGASLAITHALMALVRAGDHVVVERPTYEALHRVPEILGASVSRLERKFEEGWEVVPERLAKLLTPRTRAVVLSNLHNPSGTALDAATLRDVADLAARVGAMVLVDEVYLDYCWDPAGPNPPGCLAADNVVSWSSTTKTFGFASLRAGWIVTRHPAAARAIRATSDYLHVHLPLATATLGARVLRQAPILLQRATAAANAGRAVVEQWIGTEPRVGWVSPAAGISACVRLPDLLSDVAFCEHLRGRYDTQAVPGSMFEAPGFVRLGFAGSPPEELAGALANLSSALDDLV